MATDGQCAGDYQLTPLSYLENPVRLSITRVQRLMINQDISKFTIDPK